MKRAFYVAIFLMTFVCGVAAVVFTWERTPVEPIGIPALDEIGLTTSACDLIDKETEYDGRLVIFAATGYVLDDGSFFVLHPLPNQSCTLTTDKLPFSPILQVREASEAERLQRYLLKNRAEEDLRITGRARVGVIYGEFKVYIIDPVLLQPISRPRPFTPKGGA